VNFPGARKDGALFFTLCIKQLFGNAENETSERRTWTYTM
jgi:hypothetical protein